MDTRTDSTVPRPVSVGPEMEALGRFYQDVTWKGDIYEGGMGPGTPAMTGIGHSTSQVIQDGRWIAVDSEQDQYLEDGTFVLKWQLHWVSGWDPGHGEYRAVMADNYGHADVYRGRIEGDRLVFEPMRDTGPREVWSLLREFRRHGSGVAMADGTRDLRLCAYAALPLRIPLVYRFNLNHIVTPEDPLEMFRTEFLEI